MPLGDSGSVRGTCSGAPCPDPLPLCRKPRRLRAGQVSVAVVADCFWCEAIRVSTLSSSACTHRSACMLGTGSVSWQGRAAHMWARWAGDGARRCTPRGASWNVARAGSGPGASAAGLRRPAATAGPITAARSTEPSWRPPGHKAADTDYRRPRLIAWIRRLRGRNHQHTPVSNLGREGRARPAARAFAEACSVLTCSSSSPGRPSL